MKSSCSFKARYNRKSFSMAILTIVFLMNIPMVNSSTNHQITTVIKSSPVKHSLNNTENLSVPLYKSHILHFNTPIKRISVGNPEIADILVMKSREVYILGKALGSTNALLWDNSGNLVKTFDIEVTHDLRTIREKLYHLLPKEKIEVSTSQGSIVLSGHVSSLGAMDTAKQIAQSFIKQDKSIAEESGNAKQDEEDDGVINLLTIGNSQQVMLKVTVAEVQRSLVRRWDMQFKTFFVDSSRWSLGGVNGGAYFPNYLDEDGLEHSVFPNFNDGVWGPAMQTIQTSNTSIEDKGLFGSYLTNDFFFMFSLDAAKNSGYAKILSEPTLTTLSGQEANFISGGEFPIPVYSGDGRITVKFKEYGIIVKFLPTVLNNQRIHLNIDVTASEINTTNAVSINQVESSDYIIPGLTKRSTKSSIELADGQTMAIAGLINENMRDLTEKFPFLGDLPVLGTLFRSKDYIKGETELMIMVTPTLAKPLEQQEITLPTQDYVDPNDIQFYLLGKSLYNKKTDTNDENLPETKSTTTSNKENTKQEAKSNSPSDFETPSKNLVKPASPNLKSQNSSAYEKDLEFIDLRGDRIGVTSGSFGHALNVDAE